jgi:hypothetical protein
MKSKHFTSPADVQAYIESELLATLRDDLGNMTGPEREHYEDDDRAEMAGKIADIEEHFQRKHWTIDVTGDDDGHYCMWATQEEKDTVISTLAEKRSINAKSIDVWVTPTYSTANMLEIIKDI